MRYYLLALDALLCSLLGVEISDNAASGILEPALQLRCIAKEEKNFDENKEWG